MKKQNAKMKNESEKTNRKWKNRDNVNNMKGRKERMKNGRTTGVNNGQHMNEWIKRKEEQSRRELLMNIRKAGR